MIKNTLLFGAVLAAAVLSVESAKAEATPPPAAPATATPAARSPADADFDALWAFFKEQPATPNLSKEHPREYFQWMQKHYATFASEAVAYAEKHPNDPRRWDGIVQISYTRPLFITGFKPEFDQHPGWNTIIEDEAQLAQFRAEQAKRLHDVTTAPDAGERQRGGAFYALMVEAINKLGTDKSEANKAAYLAIVDAFITRMPSAAPKIAKQHLAVLKDVGTPEEIAAFRKKLEGIDDPAVKQLLAESGGDYSRFNGVAELTFTAADGRAVDVSKLRGKVVLIDFWATWCGPCKAEIPNVVANYEKYHDKGFEVIGITHEIAGVKADATPTPEQTAKLETAKKKMLEFTQANHMPWPQYYDGKGWQNTISTRFGIDAIPAMVLLDQNGKVVSIDARGPQLEAELKRLLKL